MSALSFRRLPIWSLAFRIHHHTSHTAHNTINMANRIVDKTCRPNESQSHTLSGRTRAGICGLCRSEPAATAHRLPQNTHCTRVYTSPSGENQKGLSSICREQRTTWNFCGPFKHTGVHCGYASPTVARLILDASSVSKADWPSRPGPPTVYTSIQVSRTADHAATPMPPRLMYLYTTTSVLCRKHGQYSHKFEAHRNGNMAKPARNTFLH